MKHKVILLPTDRGILVKETNTGKLRFVETLLGENKGWIKTNDELVPQHLYILSDEEIKGEGWRIDMDRLSVGFIDSDTYYNDPKNGKFKKIISSTDKSLGLPSPDNESLKLYCENPTKYVEVEIEREDYFDEGGVHTGEFDLKFKISSNNTISFKPVVEEESWDDINSAYKEYKQSIKNQYNDKHWLQRVKPILVWLEENYNPPTKK